VSGCSASEVPMDQQPPFKIHIMQKALISTARQPRRAGIVGGAGLEGAAGWCAQCETHVSGLPGPAKA
jgi:hypothetical protein